MPFVNTNSSIDNNQPNIVNPTTSFLPAQVGFNISGVVTQADGYVDASKVEVSLVDSNFDGVSDDPEGFDKVVSPTDRIVFEYYTNEISGYQSTRPWVSRWGTPLSDVVSTSLYVYFPVNPLDNTQLYSSPFIADQVLTGGSILDPSSVSGLNYVYMDSTDLIFINNLLQITYNSISVVNSISNQLTAFFNNDTITYAWLSNTGLVHDKSDIMTNYFFSKSFLISSISPPGFGVYYSLETKSTSNLVSYPTGLVIQEVVDKYHFDKNGKVFTQNTSINETNRLPLYFKWSHYSPIDQRVDPSPSNIVDMIVITDSYYTSMTDWKNTNGSIANIPTPPTTEELRIQFQDLDQYKMVSDSMIWNSGTFKILFGPQAPTELQATFKVVKSSSTNISDNEIKTKVISAIDAYFDIRNWDFGERFFYTELAAFIHQQLSTIIGTVVIVPNNAESQFGNLFEIVAGPTQVFMSTANVNNVAIVSNLTNQNLRV
jgi:hypothetical protein